MFLKDSLGLTNDENWLNEIDAFCILTPQWAQTCINVIV